MRFLLSCPSDRFAAITHLSISFCDELLDSHLAMFPTTVRYLRLDACHSITDVGIKAMSTRCGKQLESLSVYWNIQIGNASLLALSLRAPHLRHLSISGCKNVGTEGLLTLASRCRKLETLNLTRCVNIEDTAVAAVTQGNHALRELRLYAAPQFSNTPLLTLAEHCPQLQLLDCTGLRLITDTALVAVAQSCPQLHSLVLSWAVQITDEGVCAIARCCALRLLSVHGLRGITGTTVDTLADHCGLTLNALDVRGCLHVPEKTPEQLRERLPRLSVFVLHT